jgi:hypothetical protein
VAEPGTDAVAERLFRTFKEHLVHGRVFRTIDAVREALRAFAARTNAAWPIGKNGCLGPRDARAAHRDTTLSRAAWCNQMPREPGAVQSQHAVRPSAFRAQMASPASWRFRQVPDAPARDCRTSAAPPREAGAMLPMSWRAPAGGQRRREKDARGPSDMRCVTSAGCVSPVATLNGDRDGLNRMHASAA